MKKLIFVLCAGLLMISSAGCASALDTSQLEPSPYNADSLNGGVTMSAGDGAVASDTELIPLHIQNTTEKEFYYGMASTLETYADGAWFVVPPKEDVAVIEIAIILKANSSADADFSLKGVYGTLPAGRYRVVKTFSSDSGNTAAAGEYEIS